jgi:hypothetical protein
MKCAENFESRGAPRNAWKVADGKLEGKRRLGRPRVRFAYNIKPDLKVIGYVGVG